MIELQRQEIDSLSESIPQLEEMLTAPWEHQERFDELTRRAEEINDLLRLSVNENTVGITEDDGTETESAAEVENEEEQQDT